MNPEFVFHFTSSWRDVQQKAKQIRADGFVRIISASPQYLVGEVRGDTNVYQTTLAREPGSQRIALWECGCAWASYSWGRSGRWKKYEGRVCSHALALNYEGQSRGWGGQQIQEDEKMPLWQSDPSITVKVPGDYKKPNFVDDWRVASKGDGIDTCEACASEQLFSGYFDEDDLAVTDGSGTWETVCQDCGESQGKAKTAARDHRSVSFAEKVADWMEKRRIGEGFGNANFVSRNEVLNDLLKRDVSGYNNYKKNPLLKNPLLTDEAIVLQVQEIIRSGITPDELRRQADDLRQSLVLREASTDPELHEAPAVAIAREMFAEGASEGAVLESFQSVGVFNAPSIISKLRGAPKVASGDFPWYATATEERIDSHPLPDSIRENIRMYESQGSVYRLVSPPGRMAFVSVQMSNGEYKVIASLSWFGGRATPDDTNIKGRIHKVFVDSSHRRRGLASALLDFARETHPGDDITHSDALTEDAIGWSKAHAKLSSRFSEAGELGFPCDDCDDPTFHPDMDDNEWYQLKDEVWMGVGNLGGFPEAEFLCIGCAEERLGRELTRADFTDALVNTTPNDQDRWAYSFRSDRIKDRLSRTGKLAVTQRLKWKRLTQGEYTSTYGDHQFDISHIEMPDDGRGYGRRDDWVLRHTGPGLDSADNDFASDPVDSLWMAKEDSENLLDLFLGNEGKEGSRVAQADSTDGCMIALRPPDHILDLVHIEDGEAYDNLHLTVAYLGKEDEVDHDKLESAVALWARRWGGFPGQLAGYGVFENGEEPVLHASVDVPDLDLARGDLIDLLSGSGLTISSEHGFDPHLTLAYGDFEAPESMPDPAMDQFTFSSVYVAYGQEWKEFQFTGESNRKTAYLPSLNSLNEGQLRSLLKMSLAEGQSEVEKWVREELGRRGVRVASIVDQPLVFQSKMNSLDWLQKALALVLAGGVLIGGSGTLPIVDQAYGSGYDPSPITQTVQITSEQQRMMDTARRAFSSAGLRMPEVKVNFLGGGKGPGGSSADAWGTYDHGRSEILLYNISQDTLNHELAHAWIHENVSESQKRDLVDSEDWITSWSGGDYSSRGTEIAAKAIVWALDRGSVGQAGSLWNQRFNILTGSDAMRYTGNSESELKDIPEPALPETTAEEEGDESRAWILSDSGTKGGDDMNIAQAARAHLAKTAVKTFSPAEQQALIEEGKDVVAANLDRLDITGTHYESLEDAYQDNDDDDWLW